MEYNLKPLWTELINIYQVYKNICDENGLRFWGAYGTALGAVRHHGFIPWDDDFDVIMPFEDYLKFLEVAPKKLPQHLKIITGVNTGSPGLGFAKIQNCCRNIIHCVENDLGYSIPQGLYIDIFPLYGIPNETIYDRLKAMYILLCQYGLERRNFKTLYGRIAHYLGKPLKFFHGPKTLSEVALEKRKFSGAKKFDDSDFVTFFDFNIMKYGYDASGHIRPYKREWFKNSKIVKFENVELPIPSGYDELLRECYGDYMTPPPPDKQVLKHGTESEAHWKFGPILDNIV